MGWIVSNHTNICICDACGTKEQYEGPNMPEGANFFIPGPGYIGWLVVTSKLWNFSIERRTVEERHKLPSVQLIKNSSMIIFCPACIVVLKEAGWQRDREKEIWSAAQSQIDDLSPKKPQSFIQRILRILLKD